MSQPSSSNKQAQDTHPLNEARHPLEQRSPASGMPATVNKAKARPKEDRPYLTYALLFINVAIFLVGYLMPDIGDQSFQAGALYPPYVLRGGEFYRLFTVMFLHGGPAHILLNGIALYIVGQTIEPLFGRIRFLLIYFLGGLAGSVLSVTFGDYTSASVGASGAIFAVFAAEMIHFYQHQTFYTAAARARLKQLAFLIGLQVLIGFVPGSIIDNWGHIGGVLGGIVLTWFIGPRLQKPDRPIQIKSLSDIARLDTNPLQRNLPVLVLYCLVLIGIMIFAVNTVGIGA